MASSSPPSTGLRASAIRRAYVVLLDSRKLIDLHTYIARHEMAHADFHAVIDAARARLGVISPEELTEQQELRLHDHSAAQCLADALRDVTSQDQYQTFREGLAEGGEIGQMILKALPPV